MESIGFLELSSIALGIAAADAVGKAARVKLLFARASCPGKYYLLFGGEVAAVEAALAAGAALAGGFAVDSCVIPRPHEQVVRALQCAPEGMGAGALGVMEFYSVTAAIFAADAAVKAADTRLCELRLGMGIGGKSYAVLEGEVAAVEEAVACGVASQRGMVLAHTVIARPLDEVWESLG